MGGVNSSQKRFATKTSGGELNNDEGFQETFAVLSLLRDNSRQVELLTEFKTESKKDEVKENSTEENLIISEEIKGPEKNISHDIRSGIIYHNSPNSLPVNSTIEINNTGSSFDTKMTHFKKFLLNPSSLLKSVDSTLPLSPNTHLEPYDSTTIPLHLNTFINGTGDIDPKKISQCQLGSVKVPEFNEYLTLMAANLCSSALHNGFPSKSCRKYYCTENTLDASSIHNLELDDKKNGKAKKVNLKSDDIVEELLKKYDEFQNEFNALASSSTVAGKENKDSKRNPHIICVGDEKKGCISPGNTENAPYLPKKETESEKPQTTKGISSGFGLLDPELYKKSLKVAENKRKELAKASASSKEKLNLRACQSKKAMYKLEIKDPFKASTSKSSDLTSASKCGPETQSVKNFESLTEPSSPFKCGSEKLVLKDPSPEGFSKCTSDPKPTFDTVNDGPKDSCKMIQTDAQKYPCEATLTRSKCSSDEKLLIRGSEKSEPKNPCEVVPKLKSKKNLECGSKSQEGVDSSSEFSSESKSSCKSAQPSDSNDSSEIAQNASKSSSELQKSGSILKQISEYQTKSLAENKSQAKKSTKCDMSEKVTENSKFFAKSEPKPETTLQCNSKPELKLEDPCKIRPIMKSKSIATEDPCKVDSITFKMSPEKSISASKCSAPSNPKCELTKEEKISSCASILNKSASASKCSAPSKPKSDSNKTVRPSCSASIPDKSSLAPKCSAPSKSKCISEPDKSLSASKCSSKTENSDNTFKTPSEKAASKCYSKCNSSNSCEKSEKQPLESDSEKACKRADLDAKNTCESEPKNPCKSESDSITKPKVKCGRPPRGDTRPRCKKDSKSGSTKPSPCVSKEQSKSKCGTEMKSSEEPSKCESKTCASSPKTSQEEIKPKSTCSSGHKPKKTSPSEPPKRKFHSLSNCSISNLIFSRNFSDDCPEKPKGGYKLESERSDEYRRETCDNFSWKTTKPRTKRTSEKKSCYPEETQEFCPDTACYKVYAETSGKADKKKGKKKPKANKMETNEALCTKKTNPFDHKKRHFSSKATENEEALIKKPHSVCTRRLTLPEITDNDALICVDSVALSDTDIYMFETGGRHTPALTLGNEAAGVVTEVGKSICNLKPGDHVVLESGIPCSNCDLCKIGRYNLCNNISFKGFLKNICIHPASFCHKICPRFPLTHAALIPQLALGCNACYQAGIKPNSNVAIIGSCAKTVCAAICAISMGAENVCVMCGMPETQILIEQYITRKVDCFDAKTIEKGILRMILASLGTHPDIVINFSASTPTMNASIMALKPAGVYAVGGFSSECVSFNIIDALMKEIRIVPSFRSKNMFPKAIHLLESGRAPLDCLIANCELCKWNELEGAFKLALSEGNNGPRKAIVKCQLRD